MLFFKKLFGFALVGLVFSFAITATAETVSLNKTEAVDCFDYYKFQSVQVSLGAEKNEVTAGQLMRFSGELINENSYPVVDGYVFVRIGEKNPNYLEEGQWIVDEFTPIQKISLAANESKKVSFDWTVPKSLKSGDYRADFFFSVGKKFNLGGLPFSNEVIVGFSDFSVNSAVSEKIYFDKSSTKVNEEGYNHIGNWPVLTPGEKAIISQTIINSFDSKQEVKVDYDLFFWDSLNEKDKIDSKTETVMFEAKSSKTISYVIPEIKEPVYYLRITLTTKTGTRSIVNIRLSSEIERLRLNYPAIDNFPLKKGDNLSLFACYHNIATEPATGQIIVKLSDKDGREIGRLDYQGDIGSDMLGSKSAIKADKDYTYLSLDAKVYDQNGKVVDSYNNTYSCDGLNSNKCPNSEEASSFLIKVILFIIVFLALVLLIIVRKYNKNRQAIILLVILIISLISLGAIMLRDIIMVEADVPGIFVKTKSDTHSLPFEFKAVGLPQEIVKGNVSRTLGVTFSGNSSVLSKDQAFFFDVDMSNCFNFTGGAWDTPYFNQIYDFVSTFKGKKNTQAFGTAFGGETASSTEVRQGRILWNGPTSISAFAISSDASVIRCTPNSLNCVAVGAGKATVRVMIPGQEVTADVCNETLYTKKLYLSGETDVLNCKSFRDYDLDPVENGLSLKEVETEMVLVERTICPRSSGWMNPNRNPNCYKAYTYQKTSKPVNTKTFRSFSPSWNLTVSSTTVPTDSTPTGATTTTTSASPAPGVCGAAVTSGSLFNNITELRNAQLCGLPGSTSTPITGTGSSTDPWLWRCSGINGSTTSSPACMAYITPTGAAVVAGTFDNCQITMENPNSSPVNINVPITWVATSTSATFVGAVKTWIVDGVSTTTTGASFEKSFNTVGLKTIQLSNGYAVCDTATTTIVSSGGANREI